jgi:hypothetical protein
LNKVDFPTLGKPTIPHFIIFPVYLFVDYGASYVLRRLAVLNVLS